MACKLHIQPRVFIRTGIPADTWNIQTEPHFLRRMVGGRYSAAADAGGGLLLITCTADHNLITGDVVDITGTEYTLTSETITRVNNTQFTVVEAYSATDSGTWTFDYPYTEFKQIAVDGSLISETVGDSTGLMLGTKSYKNSNFQITLPNLGASGSTWSSWKTAYEKCDTFDVGLLDENNNWACAVFGVPARFIIQNTFSDFLQFILDGERETKDLYDVCEVKCFDAILQVSDLRGYWDFSHTPKVTISGANISAVADRSGLENDISQSSSTLRPSAVETNNVLNSLFEEANTDDLGIGSDPANLDPGLEDFSIVGVFKPNVTGATKVSTIISKGDSSAGWNIYYVWLDSEVSLVVDSDSGATTTNIQANMPSPEAAYMYFVARVDRAGQITLQVNSTAEATAGVGVATNETIGDDNELYVGRLDDLTPLELDAHVVMMAYYMKLLTATEKTAIQTHMANLIERLN